MSGKCNTCIVGIIGSPRIKEGEWKKEENKFRDVIADWNERTKRFAVPHPGFANKFSYCPVCGHKVQEEA